MADTFLTRDALTNALDQIAPINVSAGAGSAGKIFVPGPDGKIDDTFLHDAVTENLTASEALALGAIINVWDSGAGVRKVRNANAATGLFPDGFVPAAIGNGANGNVIMTEAIISGLTGLTLGALYFLDPATPGGIITPKPTYTTGQFEIFVGRAISTTELRFSFSIPIKAS